VTASSTAFEPHGVLWQVPHVGFGCAGWFGIVLLALCAFGCGETQWLETQQKPAWLSGNQIALELSTCEVHDWSLETGALGSL
jgi:hypothetical protein